MPPTRKDRRQNIRNVGNENLLDPAWRRGLKQERISKEHGRPCLRRRVRNSPTNVVESRPSSSAMHSGGEEDQNAVEGTISTAANNSASAEENASVSSVDCESASVAVSDHSDVETSTYLSSDDSRLVISARSTFRPLSMDEESLDYEDSSDDENSCPVMDKTRIPGSELESSNIDVDKRRESELESSNIAVDERKGSEMALSNIGVDESNETLVLSLQVPNSDLSPDEENCGLVVDGNKSQGSVLESSNIDVSKLNEPLVPSLQVSKFETLLMIFHLALRHKYSDVFLEDMLSFVNVLAGDANALQKSKSIFKKIFMSTSSPVIHFFCNACNVYLGLQTAFKETVHCPKCRISNSKSSLNGGNYFVSLSIRNQMKDVLNRPHIKFVNREEKTHEVICDLKDGLLYNSLMTNPNALTISFNCDSSPIFEFGPNSLWTIQFVINEVQPEQRFEAENTLVAGLWSSKTKPSMEIFLQPFIKELQKLQIDGVIWRKADGSLCESPVFAISCCVDPLVKPDVQKLTHWNGSYGCGYCLHPKSPINVYERLDQRTGLCANSDSDMDTYENTVYRRKQIFRYTAGECHSRRTDKQLRLHMTQAQNTGQVTFGAKGESVLCSLKYFNIVLGFPVDYMRAVLLGVTRLLVNLWFDSTLSSGEDYFIGRQIYHVDERLIGISPPSDIRYVMPISDRVNWKANEWRGFLLYFGLPALVNILPDVFFSNFEKFVSAVYILSKDRMTHYDVDDADRLLQKFVVEFQDLYGEHNMVYNVHLCTHLATSVSRLGPLWANSAFRFESGKGRLVKLAKGTQGVATQIAQKYLMAVSVPKLIRQDYKARESVIDFCSNIIGYKYLKDAGTCDDVTLIGLESYWELTELQKQTFITRGISTIPENISVFHRAMKKGITYCGYLTSKEVKFDDSCVRLTDGAFASLQLIMKLTVNGVEKVWSICQKFNIAVDQPPVMSSHIKLCSLEPLGSLQLIPFDDIEKKCMRISCGDKNYIAEFANTYEKDWQV